MELKECKFPQQWQKFENRQDAEDFVRGELFGKIYFKRIAEIKADFENQNGEEMKGMFFRWADEDAFHFAQYEIKRIIADVNAFFDAKEIVENIENPFVVLANQYLFKEKQNALKVWRKSVRDMGKTPTKKQTQNKIAEIDDWVKSALPVCVEKLKLRYAKAKGKDNLEKMALKNHLLTSLVKLEEKNLSKFKKKLVIEVLYLRFEAKMKAIDAKYSAENICLPRFAEGEKQVNRSELYK